MEVSRSTYKKITTQTEGIDKGITEKGEERRAFGVDWRGWARGNSWRYDGGKYTGKYGWRNTTAGWFDWRYAWGWDGRWCDGRGYSGGERCWLANLINWGRGWETCKKEKAIICL